MGVLLILFLLMFPLVSYVLCVLALIAVCIAKVDDAIHAFNKH